MRSNLLLAAAALGAAVTLAGCTDGYGGYGVGYASDYYGSPAYGPGYGDGYYDGGYGYGFGDYGYGAGDYGYGYGYPGYFGWYGDFYYPGTGIYVFDRDHRRYRWNDDQRRYWQGRRQGYRGQVTNRWDGFARGGPGYGFRGGRAGGVQPNEAVQPQGFRGRPDGVQPGGGTVQPQGFRNGGGRPAGGFSGYRGHTGGGHHH